MGNCTNCSFCNDPDEDSINNSIRMSTHSILGQLTQPTPTASMCCYKNKHKENKQLLDNIKLSEKEKKLFEKKIYLNNINTNGIQKSDKFLSYSRYQNIFGQQQPDKLDFSDISLSISNKLFINELDQ